MPYDRAYLLSAAKRNQVLSLEEVVRYGEESFGDPDYVSLYGLRPPEWYARGVRLLARTAVECTRDALARRIARDVAALAPAGTVVVDPFAGSANTLFWLARGLGARRAVGFELDERVFAATQRNLAVVGFDAELEQIDHETGLRVLPDEPMVVFVAPPWGDALDPVTGLDLRRTQPPVTEILDLLAGRRAFVAIQVHESVTPGSLDAVRARGGRTILEIYDELNAPGQRHGLLLYAPAP
jgi:16S rRNA G966 N2-methylase RsmD